MKQIQAYHICRHKSLPLWGWSFPSGYSCYLTLFGYIEGLCVILQSRKLIFWSYKAHGAFTDPSVNLPVPTWATRWEYELILWVFSAQHHDWQRQVTFDLYISMLVSGMFLLIFTFGYLLIMLFQGNSRVMDTETDFQDECKDILLGHKVASGYWPWVLINTETTGLIHFRVSTLLMLSECRKKRSVWNVTIR